MTSDAGLPKLLGQHDRLVVAAGRGLAALERSGLVRIDRAKGRKALVTIIAAIVISPTFDTHPVLVAISPLASTCPARPVP
jgi:hypothetical protein